MATKAIPEGFQTVTPYLNIKNAAKAIEFYKQAFGGEEICRMNAPDGSRIMHAAMKIGNSIIFIADEYPEMGCKSPETLGGNSGSLHLYVEKVDEAFQRAIKAGGKEIMPPTDMFWGDRFSKLADPFGHQWSIATHVEDLSEEEQAKRAKEFFSKAPACAK